MDGLKFNMPCYLRNHAGSATLFVTDSYVKIVIRKKEITIPFESIQSIVFKQPAFLTKGSMAFKTAQPKYGSIHWGMGISTDLNDANTVLYDKENLETAYQIKSYIEEKCRSLGERPGYYEELEQLKLLLEKNVITQEEFDAKKKQILGL